MSRFVIALLFCGCTAEVAPEDVAEIGSELSVTALGPFLATGVSSDCLKFSDDRCCASSIPRINGTVGPDVIAHGGVSSCIRALPGADNVTATSASNVVLGGEGADTVHFGAANRMHGGNGNDHLFGSPGADVGFGDDGIDILNGGAGDDTLFGGPGNDTIDGGDNNDRLLGGPGLDDVRGGNGSDTLVVGSACEIVAGDSLNGGAGTDTVVSPFTAAELAGMGATLVSIERVVVAVRGLYGGCLLGSNNVAHCTCCDEANRDPARTCEECESGYQLVDGHGPIGPDGRADDELHDDPIARPMCARIVQTCSELDCAPGSRCRIAPNGGGNCDCGPHQSGADCSECVRPYSKNPVTGECELGEPCHLTYCGGTGFCHELPDGTIECRCPNGAPGCGQPGRPTPIPLLPPHPRDELVLHAGPAGGGCGPFEWSIVSGGGEIDGDDETATYYADFTPEGDIDYVIVRAVPDDCPMQAQDFQIVVLASGAMTVTGAAGPEFVGLDQAMLDYMAAHGIPGGAVTVTFQGQTVYNRGFGTSDGETPMRPSNYMRLASVTKPITRAAIRELAADGLLQNNLSDLVWPILQGGGADVLALGSDSIARTTLPVSEYQTASGASVNAQGVVTPVVWRTGSAGNLNTSVCRTINTTDRRFDARWGQITVADLVNHRAGFDRSAGFIDPLTSSNVTGDLPQAPIYVSTRLPITAMPPPSDTDFVQLIAGACMYYTPRGGTDANVNGGLGAPLDPWGFGVPLPGGDRYSNLGYNLLGRVVERLTGETFLDYVDANVLAANGIDAIEPGRTQLEDRDSREALYFERFPRNQGDVFSAVCSGGAGTTCAGGTWTFPNDVPTPDGGDFALEYRDSTGRYIATTCGLADFMRTYTVGTGARRTPGIYPTAGEGSMSGALPGTGAFVWQLPTNITVRTPMAGTPYNMLPQSTVSLTAGYHVAVLFNGDRIGQGDPGYDDGIHNSGLLADMIATALDQADGNAFTEVDCFVCGDGVREADEECDGTDFGGESCGSRGFVMGDLTCAEGCVISTELCDGVPPPVPIDEDVELNAGCDGSESEGDPGCLCLLTNTGGEAIDACGIDPTSFACEESQPDGPDFADRFCPGDDVVCGITAGGNPICRACGTGEDDGQDGCPCNVVDCENEGLGCWGDGEWGTNGRCWDQDEPPNHICIEECAGLVDSAGEGYRPVCVGPHTGHSLGSPHTAVSSFAGHPSYCASTTWTGECATTGWCEENGGNVCGIPSAPFEGGVCREQCFDDEECAELGFPSFYSCSNGTNRCVPTQSCDGKPGGC
jgi:Ca2+-binding RTX toxin-like protein